MKIDLTGKNAFVSGSSKGIGRAIAIELAAAGASVTIAARDQKKLALVMDQLDCKMQQNHSILAIDFLDHESLLNAFDETGKKFHILINNAGGPKSGNIFGAELSEFESAFKMHLHTSHLLTQTVVPFMKSEKYGRIINIISTSVRIPIAGLGVSNTVRGAMASWSKTMANELGGYGITVNNILPGFTDTDRLRELITARASQANVSEVEIADKMKGTVPVGRFAKPVEIASVACFLASPAASYVNGTNIPVDGGKTGAI